MSIRFDPLFRLHPVFSTKSIAPNREPLVFQNELRKCIQTSLMGGSFFLFDNGKRLTFAYVNRFDPLFRLRPVFSTKIIAPNLEPLVFQNELRKCIRTSLMGGSFFVGRGEGDRSIGEANLRKGRSPFNGWHAPCLAGAPCAWSSRPAPGWYALCQIRAFLFTYIIETFGFFVLSFWS